MEYQQTLRRVSALVAETRASHISKKAWVNTLILGLALGVGIVLRVWQINLLGYNTDEAVYAGQAVGIAGIKDLSGYFPIFRAHPLLFQFLLSIIFRISFVDLWGRLLAAALGVLAIYVTYLAGKQLYGDTAGVLAAVFIALMPYHVVVSRQVLLDGPLTLCATFTLYMLARFGVSQRREWLFAAGAAMGLTFLAKETGIVLLGGIYAFLALAGELKVRLPELGLATAIMAAIIAPFPISLILAGGKSSGQQYLIWQLFRQPNHEWSFYASVVPPAIGPLVIIAAILGLWLFRRENSWREKLLLSWILVPVAFFQLWPTKGYQYLLPIAPPVAILAGGLFRRWPPSITTKYISQKYRAWIIGGAAVLISLSLLYASAKAITPVTGDQFLAGSGGVPGGREAGMWIEENIPEGAQFLTIGPSMANILQFYGRRKAYGLSVSPNPLHRNPSYQPVHNPDLQIRRTDIQYLVWDSYSASRSDFFSQKILSYVKRYNGRVVHTESVTVKDSNGKMVTKPVIIIYEVNP